MEPVMGVMCLLMVVVVVVVFVHIVTRGGTRYDEFDQALVRELVEERSVDTLIEILTVLRHVPNVNPTGFDWWYCFKMGW